MAPSAYTDKILRKSGERTTSYPKGTVSDWETSFYGTMNVEIPNNTVVHDKNPLRPLKNSSDVNDLREIYYKHAKARETFFCYYL